MTGELTIAEAHRNTVLTKVLAVYSTILTTLLAAFTLAGFAAAKVQQTLTRSMCIASMFVSPTARYAW